MAIQGELIWPNRGHGNKFWMYISFRPMWSVRKKKEDDKMLVIRTARLITAKHGEESMHSRG